MQNYFRWSVVTIALLSINHYAEAQILKNYEFGKGIRFLGKDSTYYMKMSARVQNRFDNYYNVDQDPTYDNRFYLKRGRLKFDGFVLSPKFIYKIEFDVVGGYVRDAWVRWNLYKNFSVQYGLGKLPGNRERVVSSQKLQFVDRSILNDEYNIDRDNGFQFLHHFKIGSAVIKEVFAYSDGRGINDNTSHDGASYTGRVDILPFGNFQNKGDFFYADFEREPSPKLMLGVAYNYNDKAIDQKGQIGDRLSETRNLSTVFSDLMLKYRGLTVFGEYHYKSTISGSPVVEYDSSGTVLETFFTGHGYVGQVGYLTKNNWELSARYTKVVPEQVTQRSTRTEYTLGLSKYVREHNLKVQTDLSYLETLSVFNVRREDIILRFQVELSF